MNRLSKPLRLYAAITAIFTLAATVLRSACLLLAFDAEIGYFQSKSALVTALYIMEGIFLLVALCLPLFWGKDQPSHSKPTLSLGSLIGAGVTAICAVLVSVCLFASLGSTAAPGGLLFFAALLLLVGAAYFVMAFLMQSPAPGTACALGYGALFGVACLLAVTYFDRYTQMNAPHKISAHLCLLTVMLFLVYELRLVIGRPMPRALMAASALAFFFNAACGISNVVAFLAGRYDSALYLSVDLFSVAFALYAGARMVDTCLAQKE